MAHPKDAPEEDPPRSQLIRSSVHSSLLSYIAETVFYTEWGGFRAEVRPFVALSIAVTALPLPKRTTKSIGDIVQKWRDTDDDDVAEGFVLSHRDYPSELS